VTYELYGVGGLTTQNQLKTFQKRLLSRFRVENLFNQFGMEASIPKHGGISTSFRRMEPIYAASGGQVEGVAPSVLTEGTHGAPLLATFSQVLATVSQYGQWAALSDLAELQSIDEVKAEYVENFSEAMRDGLDLVTRDVMTAGTSVQYASIAATRGGASGVASGMYLNLAELREGVKFLKGAGRHAKPVRQAGNKWACITHVDAMFDLSSDPDIVQVWQQAGERGMGNQLFDAEFRDLPGGIRIWETTNSRIFSSLGRSGADVYATLLFGAEWYGTVKLDALPAKVIVKERGSGGTSDPLDQLGTIGWKAAHTAVILNQNLGLRIEHVSSTKNAA
jgi:N4-gp56 family major capsid protein